MNGTAANTLAHQFARLTRPHYHPKLALGKQEKEENGTAYASPCGGGSCGAGDALHHATAHLSTKKHIPWCI